MKINLLLISFCTILIFTSCSIKQISNTSNTNKIERLYTMIQNLSTSISKDEALKLSQIAVLYSLRLKDTYHLVSPPLYHNILINLKIKEKGYCYDFTKDLMSELKKQNFKTLTLRWAVHKRAQYFEHNSLLISQKNKAFNSGIILDAWRNSGDLFFSYLKNDKKYSWSENIEKSKVYGTLK